MILVVGHGEEFHDAYLLFLFSFYYYNQKKVATQALDGEQLSKGNGSWILISFPNLSNSIHLIVTFPS